MNRIEPTTIYIGHKAHQLFKELAGENGVASKYFFTQMLIREARAEATMLTADRLEKRLALIDEVNNEQVELINNPPKGQVFGYNYSTEPKKIYARIWAAHRRLSEKGWSDGKIHEYCLDRFGMDIKTEAMPQKSPKKNPNWVGGGKAAAKIKQAKEVSRKLEEE